LTLVWQLKRGSCVVNHNTVNSKKVKSLGFAITRLSIEDFVSGHGNVRAFHEAGSGWKAKGVTEVRFLSELWMFSRFRWLSLFRKTGWTIQTYLPNRLFYMGYSILDSRFSIRARSRASKILGSSCLGYVLKKVIR